MFPLKDDNPSRTVPYVTWFLIAVNILCFLGEMSLSKPELNALLYHFGVLPHRFIHDLGVPQSATLLSSMFLHAGWLHLISNMWALFLFGDNVEDRLGHFNFFCFYMTCGIIAGVCQILAAPGVNIPTVGASGAIAGVLGGYALLFPQAQVITLIPIVIIPVFIHIPAYFYLGFWFLSQAGAGMAALDHASLGSAAQSVAWWAHVGGFIAGLILVKVLERSDYNRFYRDEYWPY
jgi:membrane associated rhomboid family serine protease